MITIKTPADLHLMDEAGRIVEETLRMLARTARAGMTTEEFSRKTGINPVH